MLTTFAVGSLAVMPSALGGRLADSMPGVIEANPYPSRVPRYEYRPFPCAKVWNCFPAAPLAPVGEGQGRPGTGERPAKRSAGRTAA